MSPARQPRKLTSRRRRVRKTVRVVAVAHPPRGPIGEDALDEEFPFITDAELGKFMREVIGLPSDTGLAAEPFPAPKLAAVSNRLFGLFALAGHPQADEAIKRVVAILVSSDAADFFEGAGAGKKGNSVYAVEAFAHCHRAGLYPPLWTLDWLNDAFTAYLDSRGDKDLSSLLGLKRGKGQTPAFDEIATANREAVFMLEMMILNALGITIPDAAAMVAARYESLGEEILSEATLADRFTKKRWSALAKELKLVMAGAPRKELKAEFIALYPDHAIPNRWK